MKQWINLSNIKSDLLKTQMNNYKNAGKKAMKEIRKSIVDEWFGEFSSTSMNNATQYNTYTQLYSDDTARIIIRSAVYPDMYNHGQSAQNWYALHGGNSIPEEYVLDLQLEQGIIGLPEKSTVSDWVNPNFHQNDPLRLYIENNAKWQEFEDIVNKYI